MNLERLCQVCFTIMKLHLPLLLLSSLCLSSAAHAVTVGGASGDGSADNPYTPTDTTITISGSGDQFGTYITLGAGKELHFANSFDTNLTGVFTLADGSTITGNVAGGGNKGWGVAKGSNLSTFHIGTADAPATATISVSRLCFSNGTSSTFDIATGSTLNFTGGLTGYNGTSVFNVTGGGTMVFTGTNDASTSYGFSAVNANVDNGTLQIGDGAANGTFTSGNVTLGANGNLVFNNTGSTDFTGTIGGTGKVSVANEVHVKNSSIGGAVELKAGSTLVVGESATAAITLGGPVTGTGVLEKKGSGQLNLNAAMAEADKGWTLKLSEGATRLQRTGTADMYVSTVQLSGGNLEIANTNDGASSTNQTVTLHADTLQVDADASISSYGSSGSGPNRTQVEVLSLKGAADTTLTIFRKAGDSSWPLELTLKGAGDYAGTIHVKNNINGSGWDNSKSSPARLNILDAMAAQNAVVLLEGGSEIDRSYSSLNLYVDQVTIGGLASNNSNVEVKIGGDSASSVSQSNLPASSTLTINAASGKTHSYSGKLGSNINLVKTGAGRQEFSSLLSVTAGMLRVEEGVFALTATGEKTVSSVTLGDAGVLELSGGQTTVESIVQNGTLGSGKIALADTKVQLSSSIDTLNLSYTGNSYLTSQNTGTFTFSGLEAGTAESILFLTATGSGIFALGEAANLDGKTVKLYQDGAYVNATMNGERHLVGAETVQELTAGVTGDHSSQVYYSNGGVTLAGNVDVKSLTLNGAADARELNLGGSVLALSTGETLAYAATSSTDAFTVANGTLKTDRIDIVQGGQLNISASLLQAAGSGAGIVVGLGSGQLAYSGSGSVDVASVSGLAGSRVSVGGGSGQSALVVGSDAGYLGSYAVNQGGSLTFNSGVAGGAGISLNNGSTLVWGAGNTTDYSALMTVANNASVTLNTGSNDVTFNRALSATGTTYTKVGSGTLSLTQAGAVKGNLLIEEGAVSLGARGDSNGIVHGTITVGKAGETSTAKLILHGNDGTGYNDATGVTSLTVHQGATVQIDTAADHKSTNQTFSNMTITLAGGTITGGAFDMFGTRTSIHATADSEITSNVRFRQSGGNGNIVEVDTGATLTLSGMLEEYSGNSVDFFKKGAGTLVLKNAGNNYSKATHIEAGTLRLDAGAKLGDGAGAAVVSEGATLEVANSALGNQVQVKNADAAADVATIAKHEGASGVGYFNVKIGGSGIAAADASVRSGRSEVRDASIQIGENQTYGIENTDLVNTLVGLQSGSSVSLKNVAFNESSSVSFGEGAKAATLTGNSSLALGSLATYTNDTVIDGHTYAGLTTSQFAGATMGSGTLTLDVTNSLLMSEGLAGKKYLAITLEGFTAADGTTFDTSSFKLADHLTGGFDKGTPPSIVGVDTTSVAGGTVVYVQFAPAQMPEPATATLGLLGFGSLLLRRRRKA